jgi:glycosyltransferase involved in cell wall biosynthesis
VPDVSVVIPTYNRKNLLAEAIASCFNGNDPIDVEVIVVDDHSSDGTSAYLDQIDDDRVRAFTNPGNGVQPARNAGLDAARGETVRFLDDDDYFYPGALTRHYQTLLDTEADVVYSDLDKVRPDGKTLDTITMGPAEDMLHGLCTSKIYGATTPFLYRTSVANQVDWRTDYTFHGDDMAYVFDVAALDPKIAHLPSPTVCWRMHGDDSLSDRMRAERSATVLQRRFSIVADAFAVRKQIGSVSTELREATAQSLWKYAWMIAPLDFSQFQEDVQVIESIDPTFRPSRRFSVAEAIDRIAGPVATEMLCFLPRKTRAWARAIRHD